MSSREKILKAVQSNQPATLDLPSTDSLQPITYQHAVEQYSNTLQNIGGAVIPVSSLEDISNYIRDNFTQGHNLVTTVTGIEGTEMLNTGVEPHALETVELALLHASLGVAENGAVWLSDSQLIVRVLPFICQHLAVILNARDIVHNMHEAYEKIGTSKYGFGVFIAGPSKTADIEQSLVLGAHGPRGMSVFLMNEGNQ